MTIRMVTTDDAADVCKICGDELGYPSDKFIVMERIKQLNQDKEAVFVAEQGGVVVGFVHVEIYNTLYFEASANILGLAVSSSCRNTGIGKALLDRAEHWAMENDIELMRLSSSKRRADSHQFYAHQGYYPEKEQVKFVKRLPES
ncbi:MAG: GNAT family N-acetyltransferase [Eubacterium sp.]|nr:GNAT family N-acetyltransferase [Eubacterium sp.]